MIIISYFCILNKRILIMRKFVLSFVFILTSLFCLADAGMWLPILLKQNEAEMQKLEPLVVNGHPGFVKQVDTDHVVATVQRQIWERQH